MENVHVQFSGKVYECRVRWLWKPSGLILCTSLDGVSRLAGLSVQTARAFAGRGARNLAALSEVRDLHGLAAVQTPMVLAAVDQSLAYSRRAYEICSESSLALVKVLDTHVTGSA
jgi:phasin family protein